MKFLLFALAVIAIPMPTSDTRMQKRDSRFGVLQQLHLGKRDEISDLVQDIMKAAN
jgi:hypothetical protein